MEEPTFISGYNSVFQSYFIHRFLLDSESHVFRDLKHRLTVDRHSLNSRRPHLKNLDGKVHDTIDQNCSSNHKIRLLTQEYPISCLLKPWEPVRFDHQHLTTIQPVHAERLDRPYYCNRSGTKKYIERITLASNLYLQYLQDAKTLLIHKLIKIYHIISA